MFEVASFSKHLKLKPEIVSKDGKMVVGKKYRGRLNASFKICSGEGTTLDAET